MLHPPQKYQPFSTKYQCYVTGFKESLSIHMTGLKKERHGTTNPDNVSDHISNQAYKSLMTILQVG